MDGLPTRCNILSDHAISPLVVYPFTLLQLCFTNKQLNHEGLQVWLRRTRLVMSGDLNLRDLDKTFEFLTAINGFKDVRMLTINSMTIWDLKYWEECPSKLASSCPGLRKLNLEIPMLKPAAMDFSSTSLYKLVPPDEVSGAIALEPLFRLQALRHLTVVITGVDFYARRILDVSLVTTNLKVAIRDGFEAARKTDKVEIVYVERQR